MSDELAKMEAAGPLSVDWLTTSAALQIRAGHIEEARQLILLRARESEVPGLFASCINAFTSTTGPRNMLSSQRH